MRKILVVVIFLVIEFSAMSQSLRNVKGLVFLDAQFEFIPSGNALDISFSKTLASKVYYQLGGNYVWGTSGYTDFEILSLENSINFNVLSLYKRFYFNLGTGLSIGYELLASNIEQKTKEQLVFAPMLLGSLEILVYQDLSLILGAKYIKRYKSNFLKDYSSILLGIRFYL